jgi:hypothetical protein
VGACPQRSGALAGPEKPGARKPRLLHRFAQQSRTPLRTRPRCQRAWKTLRVRPATGAADPERTDERYCTYYTRHRDYGYRPAYVEKLVRECSTAAGFTSLTGSLRVTRSPARWSRTSRSRGFPQTRREKTLVAQTRGRLPESSRMQANSGAPRTDRPPVPSAAGDANADALATGKRCPGLVTARVA